MAEVDLYDQTKTRDALGLVTKAVEDCERRYHNSFVEKCERRYGAYRGLPEAGTEADEEAEEDWHSNITAPYVLQTVEGMLATMLEPKPKFDIEPRPHPEEPLEEVIARMDKSEVLEDLLGYAMQRDRFAIKQRPFMQQDLICGLTVLKDYWHTERRDVTEVRESEIEITDGYGNVADTLTSYEEETVNQLVRDDACSEVRDVRDFFWPSQATSAEKAEYLVDRTWESYSEVERKTKAGYYRDQLSKLKESRTTPPTSSNNREQRLRGVDRTQDLVEVLEYWTRERVITVGNRSVILNDRPNPFWQGRIPFIICSAVPDAFQIPGISVVEALAQLQEMLWTLQNQRLDVLRMVANMITLIRSDVDDPEAFEWAPNAQWFVEDPGQVQPLQVDATAATITLQAEALLKGDLQNIMGGLPYAGGADSGGMDQETATGVSIITSIAQRLIQARKQHYTWAFAELGKDFLLLYQQFLRDDRTIKIVGMKGAQAYKTISPRDLVGGFDVNIDVTSDSLIRQERRAEWSGLMNNIASMAPVLAQFGAAPNLKAYNDKLLDAYDVQDKERFYLPPQQQAPLGQAPNLPGVPSQPAPNGGGGGGVTNPAAAAGPTAVSNENTISPEAMMQQFMAQRGAGG